MEKKGRDTKPKKGRDEAALDSDNSWRAEPRGAKGSVRFNKDQVSKWRKAKGWTAQQAAFAAVISYSTYRRAEAGRKVSIDVAIEVAMIYDIPDYKTVTVPVPNSPSFRIVPIEQSGANQRPHPSSGAVDEAKGYQFTGDFIVEAKFKCDVTAIELWPSRDDHLPICASPGKDRWYTGPLPGGNTKYGYIYVDGEKVFTGSDGNFLKILPVSADQKLNVYISRWARALGISRKVEETESIWYWLENQKQIVKISYMIEGETYKETHDFVYNRDGVMALKRAKLLKS